MYQTFDLLGYTMAINGTDSNHKLKFVEGLGAQLLSHFYILIIHVSTIIMIYMIKFQTLSVFASDTNRLRTDYL